MAKIKQGILGGFSGKVAGVVGTSWKGRAVMKSQPLSVANPRTEAQQEQRGKFSKIAELASAILTTFVQPVENPISGNISGYNKFVKDNKAAFSALGKLVADNFGCGGGKIINIESPSVLAVRGDTNVTLSWTNSAGLSAIRLTDKVYAVVFDIDGNVMSVSGGTATRDDGLVDLEFNEGVSALGESQKVVVLFAAVSADGREVSVFTKAIEKTAV